MLAVAGCGGGGGGGDNSSPPPVSGNPPTFSVGGIVAGLTGTLVLQNNGGDTVTLTANGSYSFTTRLTGGATYQVTVLTQPAAQTCDVAAGRGTVAAADVTSINLVCRPTPTSLHAIGGAVAGLVGTVVLQNVNGDQVSVSTNGPFAFGTRLPSGSPYRVEALTQPVAQTCTVSGGVGAVPAADVSSIQVTCTTIVQPPLTWSIGGRVSGLTGVLSVQNNGGDELMVVSNGLFSFAGRLLSGATYAVTVQAQPAGQQCTVTNANGTVAAADVASIQIACAAIPPPAFTVGGTAAGLAGPLVLQNNGTDDLTVAADGPFTFATPLLDGASHEIVVASPPPNQACIVRGGTGAVGGTDVTTVRVICRSLGISRYAYVTSSGDPGIPVPPPGPVPGLLAQFTVDAQGGLAPASPATVATGLVPRDVAVDPSGRYAYVAAVDDRNTRSGSVWQYTIGNDGTLSPMTPSAVPAGLAPSAVAVDPTGRYVYVTNFGADALVTGSISQYAIGGDGALTPLTPASIALDINLRSISIDPAGLHVYVTGSTLNPSVEQRVLKYAIGQDGALAPLTPPSFAIDSPVLGPLVVEPFGRSVYVVEGLFSRIFQFARSENGQLSFLSPANVFPATLAPGSVAVEASGRYAFVGAAATISQYTIGSDGTLTFNTPERVFADYTGSMAVDHSGRYLYAEGSLDNVGARFVRQYTIGTSGTLTPMIPASVPVPGIGGISIAISP